jgi:hypothetical protein
MSNLKICIFKPSISFVRRTSSDTTIVQFYDMKELFWITNMILGHVHWIIPIWTSAIGLLTNRTGLSAFY